MEKILYRGGLLDNGNWREDDLPDVATGFTIILNHENMPHRNSILRRIFKTVSCCFQPFLPPLEKEETIVEVQRWIYEANLLLEQHGLAQIKVCLAEEKNTNHE